MQSSSRSLARPSKDEWPEFTKLFRGNADMVFLFEQLRIRNPVSKAKLTKKFDPAWIPAANLVLRRAERPSIKRYRLRIANDEVVLYETHTPGNQAQLT
ncbi:hypothetical protein KW796_02690 [Candidatus Parcubacteria bacterium]|nr:hypothetical protein [Candidatus Parcubacteria bacterium]